MTSFYEVGGDDKTIPGTGDVDKAMFIYKWNVDKSLGLERLDAAAHYLWDKGYATKDGQAKLGDGLGDEVEFDTLSRSDKLGLIELHLKQVEKDLASAWYIADQTDTARDAAIVASDENFGDLEP